MPTTVSNALEQFQAAIQSAGLTPPTAIVADGKLHRFATNGKADDDSGWYVLHGDGIPAGAFGCWRSDIKQAWCAGKPQAMTATERAAHAKRVAELQQIRKDEEAKQYADAAKRAQAILKQGIPVKPNHPYLKKKNIEFEMVRRWLKVDSSNRLIIPILKNEKAVQSLQFIAPDESKRSLEGGKMKDGWFMFYRSPFSSPFSRAVVVTEGFATGCAIYQALRCSVVVAFSAGNLLSVAKSARADNPKDIAIIIAADNDVHSDGKPNIGVLKAQEAAGAVGGLVAIPPVLDNGPTDWNDVFVKQGLEAVKQSLEAVKQSIEAAMASAKVSKGTRSMKGSDSTGTHAQTAKSNDTPAGGDPQGEEAKPPESIDASNGDLSQDGELNSPSILSAVAAHLHTTPALAMNPNILAEFGKAVQMCGVVGEVRCAKLIYLMATSRLLDAPISGVVKGLSGSGKSYTTENTLKFFPREALIIMTAMSERALIYMKEEFSHRTLVIYEASALKEQKEKSESNLTAYFVRSLLSEGRIEYPVTVRDKEQGWVTKTIVKEGPTNVILTTTATELHGENETRMLSIPTNDSQEQTKAIMQKLAQGKTQTVDFTPWHGLQDWLATQKKDVVIPYASYLAENIPAVAVRLRRDFRSLLRLIETHALLHQCTREQDSAGHIIAIAADYLAVRELVADLIAQGVGATVSETIRETVTVIADRNTGDGVTVKTVSDALKLDRSAAHRRIQTARGNGFLLNLEEKRGKPGRYAVGDPLPEKIDLLPLSLPAGVQHTPSKDDTSMHSLNAEQTNTLPEGVQVCMKTEGIEDDESEEVIDLVVD